MTGLAALMGRLGIEEGDETPGLAAAALEFALEGLYLNRRISKDVADTRDNAPDGTVVYGGA